MRDDPLELEYLWGYLAIGLIWIQLVIWGLLYIGIIGGMTGVTERIARTLAARWN